MNLSDFLKQYRFVFFVLVIVLFVCGSIFWASTRSRLLVVFNESGPAELTLRDQNTGNTVFFTVESGEVLNLKNSRYTILLSSNEKTYFTLKQTQGFFRTTEITGTLQEPYQATIVGTDPSSCGFYVSLYYSYSCQASTETLRTHLAATETTPSYTTRNSANDGIGSMSEVFTVNGKKYTIVNEDNQRRVGRNVLYEVKANNPVGLDFVARLNNLDANRVYSAKPYGNGFIAYDNTLQDVYYFMDLARLNDGVFLGDYVFDDQPELNTGEVSANDEHIVSLKNNIQDINRSADISILKIGKEVVEREYVFDSILTKPELCHINKICVFVDGVFTVFDVENENIKTVHQMRGVQNYVSDYASGDVGLVFDEFVVAFNVVENSGFVSLDFSGFNLENIHVDTNGYTAHIRTGLSTNAVNVDVARFDTNNPLGVVRFFENIGFVDGASMYKNRIFLTPVLGEPEFIESLGFFDYPQDRKDFVDQQLRLIINESGLNTDIYDFVNLLR